MPVSEGKQSMRKWKIHTELVLRKYRRHLVGILCSPAGNNYLFCHYKSSKGKVSDTSARKLLIFP